MTDLIITFLSTCGISSIITFFLTKKKYNVEVDGGAIENADRSLDFYVKLVEDMKKQLTDIKAQSNSEFTEIKKQNEELQLKVTNLSIEINSMKKCACYNEKCTKRAKEPKQIVERKIQTSKKKPNEIL